MGDRPTRQPGRRTTRRAGARHPGAVRVTAEGAGRRRRAQPANPAGGNDPGRRTAGSTRAGDHRRGAIRRHPAGTPSTADRHASRRVDHHARVAVFDAHLRGSPDPVRCGNRDRRRDPRHRRHQAGRSPGAVAGTARRHVGRTRAAHRFVGDRPSARGGCPVLVGRVTHHHRGPRGGQDFRADRAGAGPGYGQPGGQHHLARCRGASGRPRRNAQLDDRVRQLTATG